jgi:hypothetical protein
VPSFFVPREKDCAEWNARAISPLAAPSCRRIADFAMELSRRARHFAMTGKSLIARD